MPASSIMATCSDDEEETPQDKRRASTNSILEDLFGVRPKSLGEDSSEPETSDDDDDDDDRLDLDLSAHDGSQQSHSAYSRFLTDDSLNDITLQGCDGVKVPANRAILASKSRIFQRLLLGSFAMDPHNGTFKSVSFDFRGEVLRAVVEFVLTDTAKILDIRSIRAEKRKQQQRSSVKSIQSAPVTTRMSSMFDMFTKPRHSDSSTTSNSNSKSPNHHRSSKSVSSRRSGGSRSMPLYSRQQIQTLVSLTRAAGYFQLPHLGSQALDTLAHYLQRSPSSVFCVLESCRQEPSKVPKELEGIAQVSLRNFCGPIESDTVEFLTPPVLEEILTQEKLRMDEYQLFKILKRWAREPTTLLPPGLPVGVIGGASNVRIQEEEDAQTVKSSNTKEEKQNKPHGKDDHSNTTDTSRTASVVTDHSEDNTTNNNPQQNDNNDDATPLLSAEVRKKMVTAHFLQYIRLECIDPPILASEVAKSGLVTQEQLLEAFKKQAMASHKYHGIAFQRPRHTGASWRKSLSNVFTSRHSDELKEDTLNYPPIKSGIHRWTLVLDQVGDSTWLGLTMSNLCESFSEDDAMQDRNWVYSCDGECFFGGEQVPPPLQGVTIPGYGSGMQVTLTLNLKSRDPGNGTLFVGESPQLVPLFTDLRQYLNDHEGEGFLPSVSMHTPGQVRLVDIRHLHG